MNQFSEVDITTIRNYWNEKPCNIDRSAFEFGTKDYFDSIERNKYFVEPHIPEFADFLKYRGQSVLEVGCGMGTETVNFARSGAHVTAIDISDQSVEICKKRLETYNLTAEVRVMNAEAMLLDTGIFDHVWSFGVIHHSPHPDRCLFEIYRVLKTGGTLKLMVYNRFSYKLFSIAHAHSWKFSKIDSVISRWSEAQEGCPVTYSYTPESITRLLEQVGFKNVSVQKAHIFKYDIPQYVKGRYVVDHAFKNMSDSDFAAMESEVGWHLLVTAEK